MRPIYKFELTKIEDSTLGNLTLDSIAYGGLTYREIFETRNSITITPGFESGNFSPFVINAGSPTVQGIEKDSGTYALKASGTTSQQIKSPAEYTAPAFVACRAKVTSYTSGVCGVQYSSSANVGAQGVTDWQTFVGERAASGTSVGIFIGSFSSANLTGYVDTPVVVMKSVFSTAPTLSQFTQLYNTYVALKKIDARRVFPIYKDDLAKNYEKESNQEFFRAKLSGKLTFENYDYDYIVNTAFDTQFILEIFISYNAGNSWTSYWRGTFWKTDCEFDGDAETVVVQPTVLDQYNDILAGLDKEYNLIDLAPSMAQIKADKRPMIQVYVPGQNVVGCFLSGMWWEQEAEPESDETKLVNNFYFSLNKVMTIANVTGSMSPQLPDLFTKTTVGNSRFNPREQGTTEFTGTTYKLVYAYGASSSGSQYSWSIVRISDNVTLWRYAVTNQYPPALPVTVTLSPVSGSGATGNVTLSIYDIPVYSRFVCDTQQISGLNTYAIPDDDIVENNRNYTRVIGYYFPDTIYFSTALTETPNQWGLYQPGQYYQPPYLYWTPEMFPVARNAWGRVSIWFTFSAFDWIVEESGRQPFTIRHAYPLWAVLNKLLEQVAPDIDFRANYTCSQFLYPYDVNPISGLDFGLFITPKSNIVTAGYDQPAQKAPITLGNVFDMLRDCFRCYWFVDDNNHLHIEHIQYFRNGGSYSGTPVIGIDLTTQQVPRNGKPWAFARNQFKFDKPEMAARYQFGWMDDVTQLFDGFPIDIVSKYVNPDNIEQIDVTKFTSDIDYILLNPSAVSKDGFVLLAAINQNGGYALPYYNFVIDSNDHILQNAYVAFCLLQQYYAYDMPAPNYEINGVQMVAQGIKKLKNQTIRFPVLTDPDLVELVKTNLGNGVIEKLSINLSSRNANATLKYDTE